MAEGEQYAPTLPPEPEQTRVPRRAPSALPGLIAFALAALTVLLVAVGITTAIGDDYRLATILGYIAVFTSVVGVLLGITAVIVRRGRAWGVAAILLGALANPLVLTPLLTFFSGVVAQT